MGAFFKWLMTSVWGIVLAFIALPALLLLLFGEFDPYVLAGTKAFLLFALAYIFVLQWSVFKNWKR